MKNRSTGILICLLITCTFMATLLNIQPSKADLIVVPDNYLTIQEAINAANQGDSIFVKSGVYYEHVEINKTITLVGENPLNTTIDGSGEQYTPIILITESDVSVINFTLQNTSPQPETYAILVSNTQNVTLTNNTVKEAYRGIVINNSSECGIFENSIIRNYAYGISLRPSSSFNVFVNNTFIANPTGVSLDPLCQNNTFYHNSFVNNTNQVETFEPENEWDNGYPPPSGGGNYWSDYTGVDLYQGLYQNESGSDGIGDTPYTDFGVEDNYPLMNPLIPVLPIANLTYLPTNPTTNETITFDASASYDPDGNITSYEWNFGDGNITVAMNSNITHSYPNPGNYSVTLTVTDNDDLQDKTTKIVRVEMAKSTLTIRVFPATIEIGQNSTISGNLTISATPIMGASINISSTIHGLQNWTTLDIARTNSQGAYQFVWTPDKVARYDIKAFWQGNLTVPAANSSTVTLDVTKKSSKLTIFVNPTTITIGSSVTITGNLTPAKEDADLTISYQVVTFPFQFTLLKNITTVTTNSTGGYRYIWSPLGVGLHLFQVSWQGDEHYSGNNSLSGLITVDKLSSNITISLSAENVTIGSNITISGGITPQRVNVTVVIQIIYANGTSSLNVTVNTDSNGNYEYIWNPADIGSYYIEASWEGDNSTAPAESTSLTADILPKAAEVPGIYVFFVIIAIILIVLVVWRIRKR